MENLIDIQKLTEFLQGIGDQLLTLLGNPLFWLQFAVIAVVFALSKGCSPRWRKKACRA